MKDCLLLDLDGCLFDHSHRLKYIEKKPKDYDTFYSLMSQDKPFNDIKWLLELIVTAYYERYSFDIIIYTGRPLEHKDITITSLALHYPRLFSCIRQTFFREPGDKRPNEVIKEEMLDKIRETHNIRMVIEDAPETLRMLHRQELSVLNPMTFREPERYEPVIPKDEGTKL